MPLSVHYLLAFSLISFLAVRLSTPLIARLAWSLEFVDRPGHRKEHPVSTPVVGGLVTGLGVAVAWSVAVFLEPTLGRSSSVGWILGASTVVLLVGLVDDRRPIRGRYKLLVQIAVATLFTMGGFEISGIELPVIGTLSLSFLSLPFTVLWLAGLTNGINLIDGVDGLALSVLASILLGLAFAAYLVGDVSLLLLVGIVFGAVVGLLPFNWYPARVFLGDSGSLGLGMFIAASLIALEPSATFGTKSAGPTASPYFQYEFLIMTLMAFYPLMEAAVSTVRRFSRGRAIGTADRDHFHHRLLERGWTPPQICAFACSLTGLACSTAVAVILRYHSIAAALLVVLSIVAVAGFQYCGYPHQLFRGELRRVRRSSRMVRLFVELQRTKLRATTAQAQIRKLIEQTCCELGVAGYSVASARLGASIDFRWGADCNEMPSVERIRHVSGLEARWYFLGEDDGELRVEHRILLFEFMQEALGHASRMTTEDHPLVTTGARAIGVTCVDLSCGRSMEGPSDPGTGQPSGPPRGSITKTPEQRFEFGKNWRDFLPLVNEARIREAVEGLVTGTGRSTLEGLTFLDIGAGSGLASLAARQLGASVVAFDNDTDSVVASRSLRRHFRRGDSDWKIEQGSILDRDFTASLGTFDIVYAWGVLHHTGDMWRAIDNAATLITPGGELLLALYNDQGARSRGWRLIKRTYCHLPPWLRWSVLLPCALRLLLPAILRAWRPGLAAPCHRTTRGRGMSRWHDLVDWVGGYPFDVARPDDVVSRLDRQGFDLVDFEPSSGGRGCNQLRFRHRLKIDPPAFQGASPKLEAEATEVRPLSSRPSCRTQRSR